MFLSLLLMASPPPTRSYFKHLFKITPSHGILLPQINCVSVCLLYVYWCLMCRQTKNQFLSPKNIYAGSPPFAPPGHSLPFSTLICARRGGSPGPALMVSLDLRLLDGLAHWQLAAQDGPRGDEGGGRTVPYSSGLGEGCE